MTSNIYETERLLSEYLLFHYGGENDVFTREWSLAGVLDFPARCVREFDASAFPKNARALDVGCAVGRSTFELARHCVSVIGVDFSRSFIKAANVLKAGDELAFERVDEGVRATRCAARAPAGIERGRVSFETGDATALREDLGGFDAVLAANLLCRLPDPSKFLKRLPQLVKPGGQLVITTPCTWMEEFTPRANWLCGEASSTLDGLRSHLDADFDLVKQTNLPFVIREHERKFQWTVAQGTLWRRHAN